jgi:hypothetical protein
MPGKYIGKRANSSTDCVCICTCMYESGMRTYGGLGVKFPSFLNLPLDEGGRFHITATLHLRRKSPVPTEHENTRKWAHSQCGHWGIVTARYMSCPCSEMNHD